MRKFIEPIDLGYDSPEIAMGKIAAKVNEIGAAINELTGAVDPVKYPEHEVDQENVTEPEKSEPIVTEGKEKSNVKKATSKPKPDVKPPAQGE